MNIKEEIKENEEHFEFSFERSIGEDTKFQDLFCYGYAKRKLDLMVEPHIIGESEISIIADIPTLTNMLASLLLEYGKQLHLLADNYKTRAKHYSDEDLIRYGLKPRAL